MEHESSDRRFVAILLAVALPVAGLFALRDPDAPPAATAARTGAPGRGAFPAAMPDSPAPSVASGVRMPDTIGPAAPRVFKCIERGRVVYGDRPCAGTAKQHEIAIRDGSGGIGGAVYRRQLEHMTASATAPAAPAFVAVEPRAAADPTPQSGQCAALEAQAGDITSRLRAPHTPAMGDVWTVALKAVRDQQFAARCGLMQ